MLYSSLAGFFLLGVLQLKGAEVARGFPLVSEAGVNRFSVKIKVTQGILSAEDTQISTLTGAMETRLRVNVGSGKVSGLEFTGGNVAFSNLVFTFRAGLIPVGSATMNGLVGSPSTPAPPAPVTIGTGDFNAALHEFTIHTGLLNSNAAGSTTTRNFAEEPARGAGSGTGTIVLTELPSQATATTRTWRSVLTLPVDFTQVQNIDASTTVEIKVTGTLKGAADLVIGKTEFSAWTLEGGLGTPAFDSVLSSGARAGLVWALGLSPEESPEAHFPVVSAAGPVARIVLPARGTLAPLTVEISENLGSWRNAPAASVSGGANPLPPGGTGMFTVDLPGPERFVRLRADGP